MLKVMNEKWSLIVKLNKEIDDLYHKLATYYNISDSSFWILYSLYENKEGITQKELCTNLFLSKQTINSAIKNLEKMKYIDMEYDIPNNHGKKIWLTSLGLEIAKKTVAKVMEAEKQTYSKIKEEDLDKVIYVFQNEVSLFKEEVNKITNMSSEDL